MVLKFYTFTPQESVFTKLIKFVTDLLGTSIQYTNYLKKLAVFYYF